MFNAPTKMNKPKPKKGFNLFDNMSSDDDESPRAPTKQLPRFTDTATSSVPSHPYASLSAAENFMTKNFSANPSNIPESKPPNVTDAIAPHVDDDMKQEPIIPRSFAPPGDCAGQFRQRFIRPSATSGEYNMPDSGEPLSSKLQHILIILLLLLLGLMLHNFIVLLLHPLNNKLMQHLVKPLLLVVINLVWLYMRCLTKTFLSNIKMVK
jgi:hypothetical protein